MALPVSLSGLFTTTSNGPKVSRPFLSSGGNVYIAGIIADGSKLGMVKATDPASSFSSIGADFTVTGTLHCVDAVISGDSIHVVTASNTSASAINYRYHKFDIATDAWVINNSVIASSVNPLVSTASEAKILVSVRSDGDVIVIYQGAKAASMGTDYQRVSYGRYEASVWTVGVALDNAGATNWTTSGIVIGSSDRMHFFFADATASDGYQRALTSANALEAFPAAFDTSINATITTAVNDGVSYASGGNTKVRFPFPDTTSVAGNSVKLDSADAPTVSEDSDITGSTDYVQGANFSSFAADGTTLWHTFSKIGRAHV